MTENYRLAPTQLHAIADFLLSLSAISCYNNRYPEDLYLIIRTAMLKLARKLHNWLGLLLVLQITFWFLSGLVMAVMPIEQVRGEHLQHHSHPYWQQAAVSPQQILQQHSNNAALSLSQRMIWTDNQLHAAPVYLVDDNDQRFRYDAISGDLLALLADAEIRMLAKAQYAGSGKLTDVTLLHKAPQEVQHLPVPLWQVQFDDSENSRLYLDPASGSVLRVRTDSWRLFDFFWMLHIMDYQNRSNFNNPLLISFSASALLFTFTGLMLLWQRYRPRRRRQLLR